MALHESAMTDLLAALRAGVAWMLSVKPSRWSCRALIDAEATEVIGTAA